MKLQCDVAVVNRQLPNLNVGNAPRRPLKSTLAFGKETKDKHAYFILHFNSLNKTGVRYKVNGNVEQVFSKFCSEGKATIRFINPPNDLRIKSEASQLKLFLKVLKLALEGNAESLKQFNLSNLTATATEVKAPPTKLSIVGDISKYPLRGLPRSLLQLQISRVALHTFRREILSLRALQTLDLTHNCIQKLPPELGAMPNLVELHLAGNDLGNTENSDWRWLEGAQVCCKLRLLDLSSNNINFRAPHTLGRLTGLVTLKLDSNRLRYLPRGFGRLTSLQYLSVSNNCLSSLPATMLRLKLQQVDFSGNSFSSAEETPAPTLSMTFRLGTLVEIAGSAVLNHKLYYARSMIPFTLLEYLNSSNYCGACGQATLDMGINHRKVKVNVRNLFPTVTLDYSVDPVIDFDFYCCSFNCSKVLVRRWT